MSVPFISFSQRNWIIFFGQLMDILPIDTTKFIFQIFFARCKQILINCVRFLRFFLPQHSGVWCTFQVACFQIKMTVLFCLNQFNKIVEEKHISMPRIVEFPLQNSIIYSKKYGNSNQFMDKLLTLKVVHRFLLLVVECYVCVWCDHNVDEWINQWHINFASSSFSLNWFGYWRCCKHSKATINKWWPVDVNSRMFFFGSLCVVNVSYFYRFIELVFFSSSFLK